MSVWFLVALGSVTGVLAGIIVAFVSMKLPEHLQHQWRIDAFEYLELPYTPATQVVTVRKGVFSKGWRFLIIGTVCVLAGGFLFGYLDNIIESVVFAILFWALITVAVIDFETLYIPDLIVMPLLWAGLLFYALTGPDQLQWHVIGAAAGYASLRWLPVGQGDAKLCALAGAWLGIDALLTFFMIGAPLGVIVGFIYYFRRGKSEPCPYGPSLVAALIATVIIELIKR